MADWASLPRELVQYIAYSALSTTGGVDAYMDMRAVCPSWRSAIVKPSPLVAVADLRFRPRHWVMVDLNFENNDNDARLFLHVSTGSFRRLRLPLLRDHTLIGSSDGLLILRDRLEPPHLFCVFNPLTGDLLHFAAPLHMNFDDISLCAVGGGSHSDSMLVLWRDTDNTVACAAPTGDVFTVTTGKEMDSMVTFQGDVYYTDLDGFIFKYVAPQQCDVVCQPDVDVYSEGDNNEFSSFLVESAGDLLLVRHRLGQGLKVFRVDVEHKCLEEVKSLGCCRALFLGADRCVSVDADKLPSVEGDCIYMFPWVMTPTYRGRVVRMYNLRHGRMEFICCENHHDRPFSLVQILLQYCDFLSI